MTNHVNVTIRIPEAWFDHFWSWWLDGSGGGQFMEGLDRSHCQEGSTWSDWDRTRKLLVHTTGSAACREAMLTQVEAPKQ